MVDCPNCGKYMVYQQEVEALKATHSEEIDEVVVGDLEKTAAIDAEPTPEKKRGKPAQRS